MEIRVREIGNVVEEGNTVAILGKVLCKCFSEGNV
jgi:hypothetical protein